MMRWLFPLVCFVFVSGCGSKDLGPANPSDTPPPPTQEEVEEIKRKSQEAMGEEARKQQDQLYPDQ